MKIIVLVVCLLSVFIYAGDNYLEFYKPVAVFPLDEDPNSETLTDASGTKLAQVHKAEGMPKKIMGARPFLGNAWDFNNTSSCFTSKANDGMLTIGDLDKTKGASLSFWIKGTFKGEEHNHRALGYGPIDVVLGKGIGSGKNSGSIGLFIGKYKGGFLANKQRPLFDDQWHHLVVTADFTKKSDNIVTYYDGKEVARTSGSTSSSFNFSQKKHPIVIGARSSRTMPVSIAIDDVALFNYALTADQVAGIYAGPGYPGHDQDIYLPAKAKLNGTAPVGKQVLWSKKSGPGMVRFANSRATSTIAAFSQPGEYVLSYQVAGLQTKQLKITVHSPAAPEVFAGDPQDVVSPSKSVTLKGICSIKGLDDLSQAKVGWKQVAGPARANIRTPQAFKTVVTFTTPGVYRFQLLVSANGQMSQDFTTVSVQEQANPHYVLFTNPLYFLSLDDAAKRESAGIKELTGNTCAEIKTTDQEYTLPQMTEGARPFTGNGWDFSKANSWIGVHARFNVAELGAFDRTKGLAASFWIKGENYQRSYGFLGGGGSSFVFDMIPSFNGGESGGLVVFSGGGKYNISTPRDLNLYDGKWRHIAFSLDFFQKTDNFKLYVDGKVVAQKSAPIDKSFALHRPSHYNVWGSRANGSSAPFKGMLDDIAMYNRPLTEEEINYLYNGPSQNQLNLAKYQPPVVNAGKDIVSKLPCKSVNLSGKVQSKIKNVFYSWELIEGPGTVTFSDPTKLNTTVTFDDIPQVHNPNYRRYEFRLNADVKTASTLPARLHADDQVTVVLYQNDTPPTIKLSKNPPPGVHPRILFAPEDLPEMRRKYRTDKAAVLAAKAMKDRYARSISNPHSDLGKEYLALQKSSEPSVNAIINGAGDLNTYPYGEGAFFGKIGGMAFLALMESDDVKGKELGIVLSNAATSYLRDYRPDYQNKLTHDALASVGYSYDFLYNWMTEEQRKPVRELISRMTKWRNANASGEVAHSNSSNWSGFHDGIVIAALAIEGEEGYDPEVFQQNKRKLRDFFTQYGVFQSGYAHEGWGYFSFGMQSAALSALATARRGEDLYETSNIYPSLLAQYRSIPPGMKKIASYGDAPGGFLSYPNNLIYVAAMLWPNDPVIQKMRDDLVANTLENTDTRTHNMMMIMFATGSDLETLSTADIAKKDHLPLTLFCPDKGYLNSRDKWSDDGMLFTFRSRMDKYTTGHVHPDVNSFELYSDGAEWFADLGKFEIFNDWHQTVLIDGIGGGGSSRAQAWPSFPGRMIDYQETPQVVYASGDAKTFYDYVLFKPTYGDLNSQLNTRMVELDELDLTWADFVYKKTRDEVSESWRHEPNLFYGGNRIWTFNSVNKAYRSVVMLRGKPSYVIIIDDIEKDGKPHDYQWVGNMRVGTVEQVQKSGSDLILQQKSNPKKQLLVKLLGAEGKTDGPIYKKHKLFVLFNGSAEANQVLIDAKQTINPHFKTLLLPFTQGDVMPKVSIIKPNEEFVIEFPGQKDEIKFMAGEDGGSIPQVIRNGKLITQF